MWCGATRHHVHDVALGHVQLLALAALTLPHPSKMESFTPDMVHSQRLAWNSQGFFCEHEQIDLYSY